MEKFHAVKIICGDLPEVECRMFKSLLGKMVIQVPGTANKPRGQKINIRKDVKKITMLDDRRAKELSSEAGWGFIGEIALDGFGALSEILLSGNNHELFAAIEMHNEKKFLASFDKRAWKELIPFTA